VHCGQTTYPQPACLVGDIFGRSTYKSPARFQRRPRSWVVTLHCVHKGYVEKGSGGTRPIAGRFEGCKQFFEQLARSRAIAVPPRQVGRHG
jgi:hypothetical protein